MAGKTRARDEIRYPNAGYDNFSYAVKDEKIKYSWDLRIRPPDKNKGELEKVPNTRETFQVITNHYLAVDEIGENGDLVTV
jgi:hypothetical protein